MHGSLILNNQTTIEAYEKHPLRCVFFYIIVFCLVYYNTYHVYNVAI
jgi:hypothetical protein